MARSVPVKILLNEEIKAKYVKYCDRYGISMSAMAAFIIGNWVYSQEKLADPVVEQLMDKLKDSLGDKISEVTKDMDIRLLK